MFVVYLDEFGHDGPFVGRNDPRHNTSPVFGIGGYAIPAESVRSFGMWFYKLKTNLLAWEIEQSKKHPATWEKKGSALYTTKNINKYREVRIATNRLISKIQSLGGFLFYIGIEKYDSKKGHNSQALYRVIFGRALKRLDEEFASLERNFWVVTDEHQHRAALVEVANKTMFGEQPIRQLLEAPFQVESHLYQTLQCADWLCGLYGRLGCYRADSDDYGDFEWAERLFGERIDRASRRSAVRRK